MRKRCFVNVQNNVLAFVTIQYVYINDLNLKGFEFKLKLAAFEYSI